MTLILSQVRPLGEAVYFGRLGRGRSSELRCSFHVHLNISGLLAEEPELVNQFSDLSLSLRILDMIKSQLLVDVQRP